MVWRADGPNGYESAKVALDQVQFFHGRCLDLGCGPKKIYPAKHVLGVDNNKDLQLFGTMANPDIVASVEKLDMFADASIDTVFSSHTLEHIKDYKATLADWWRVVRPGGYLILYLPHREHYPNIGMPGGNPDHVHDFVNDDITSAMGMVTRASGQGWDQLRDEVRSENEEYSFLQVYQKRADKAVNVYQAKPKPAKSLGIVRLGAFGDALWITTVLPALEAEGWHITLYTQHQGRTSLKPDPNIDEMIVQPDGIFSEGATAAQWQGAYWLHCERKHDKFINLVGSVERHLLPHPSDPNFYLPQDQRHRLMNRNYYEAVAEWAGIKFDKATVRVRFTPSTDELAWAAKKRAEWAGAFVVINPSGSSAPKFWLHVQACMDVLAAAGVGGVVVGDLRGQTYHPPKGWEVIGTGWDLRKVYTIAALADVVIGTESAIVNSVSHERPLKIVLLSHSTAENLTRDWDRTIAIEPEGLKCYPCHHIHADWTHCTRAESGAAACQHAAAGDVIAGYALQWIRGEMKEAA